MFPALGPERQLAESDAILREGLAREARGGLLQPQAAPVPHEAHGVLRTRILPDGRVAEARHELGVERTRAREIVHREEHVMDAARRRGGGRRRRTPAPVGNGLAQDRALTSYSCSPPGAR